MQYIEPIRKGLRHLDVEGVIWFSSAYEGTPESQSATKNPHKMGKTAENSAVQTVEKAVIPQVKNNK